MQIVIDIPDEQIEKSLVESKYIHEDEGEKGSVNIVLLYTNQKLEFVDISRKTDFYSLTGRYTVLPKGHGRIIDVDDLDITTITTDDYSGNEVIDVVLKEDIDNAQTIIEAESEE